LRFGGQASFKGMEPSAVETQQLIDQATAALAPAPNEQHLIDQATAALAPAPLEQPLPQVEVTAVPPQDPSVAQALAGMAALPAAVVLQDKNGGAAAPPMAEAQCVVVSAGDAPAVAAPAVDDPLQPIEEQAEYYSSGERKRMRTACESCHERKLRCVMLRCGTCLHCYNRKRVCKPREKKRRGRQQNRQNMVLMSDGQGHVFAVPATNDGTTGANAGQMMVPMMGGAGTAADGTTQPMMMTFAPNTAGSPAAAEGVAAQPQMMLSFMPPPNADGTPGTPQQLPIFMMPNGQGMMAMMPANMMQGAPAGAEGEATEVTVATEVASEATAEAAVAVAVETVAVENPPPVEEPMPLPVPDMTMVGMEALASHIPMSG